MTQDNDIERQKITGKVKWFDVTKGFGFVVSNDASGDILLHSNVLRNYGQNSIADGSELNAEITNTARGLQIVEIHEITPPDDDSFIAPIANEYSRDEIDARPLLPARVKWFDRAKGFGFANVFGRSDDIFIHLDIARRAGLGDLQSGEAVAIRVIDGERGDLAIEVMTWENATRFLS